MLDLIILLSLALGVTAVLGLLLAGFVWVPWLIGVLLVALLVALLKLSSTDESGSELEVIESFGQSLANQSLAELKQAGLRVPSGSAVGESNSLSGPEAQSAPPPNLVYRGVKYRRPKVSAAPAGQEGLYRGQPWKR